VWGQRGHPRRKIARGNSRHSHGYGRHRDSACGKDEAAFVGPFVGDQDVNAIVYENGFRKADAKRAWTSRTPSVEELVETTQQHMNAVHHLPPELCPPGIHRVDVHRVVVTRQGREEELILCAKARFAETSAA